VRGAQGWAGDRIEAVLVADPVARRAKSALRLRAFFHPYAARGLGLAARRRPPSNRKLIDSSCRCCRRADIVLLSDYAKGVLTGAGDPHASTPRKNSASRVIVDQERNSRSIAAPRC